MEAESVVNHPKKQTIVLSDGRTAVVSALKASKMIEVRRLSSDEDKAIFALASVSTEIDGKTLPPEDFMEMELKDFMKIQEVNAQLNF